MLHDYRFQAMNSDVSAWLWSESPQALARLADTEALFAQLEAELSRFQPASAVSRLNAHAGLWPQRISALLQAVLRAALDAAADSDGIFDPTVLEPLSQAGYDRSFEMLGTEPEGRQGHVTNGHARIGWRQVFVDSSAGMAGLPAGLGIDLGGIAKGWAVDRAAELLAPWGAALVDAGGDIRATAAPGGELWPIALQNPFDEAQDLLVVGLAAGAIATSSIGKRRWTRNGQAMHHLIDPRTGKPSTSDLHTVTVLAPTAAEAEVAAKVAVILGKDAGRVYLRERELTGVLITRNRSVEIVGKLPTVDTIR